MLAYPSPVATAVSAVRLEILSPAPTPTTDTAVATQTSAP